MAAEESPTIKLMRKRKANVRLSDLGERTPSSERKRSSVTTSRDAGTGNQNETPDSGTKRRKRTRTKSPGDNSGTENKKKTPNSESGRSKRTNNKPPVHNLGTGNLAKTPDTESRRSKHISTKTPTENLGTDTQLKTSDSESGRSKRTRTKTSAHNLADHNCWTNQNGGAGLTEMGGVHDWLDRLGLARYKREFDIHEVDETMLPLLTLEDLREMGITAVGPRRKIYCEIQELKKGL